MVSKSNLEIKCSGTNNTQPWRKCIASTDSLNTSLQHWGQGTVIWPSRSFALSKPKGILAAKAQEQPHGSLPGPTVQGKRLSSSIVPVRTMRGCTRSAPAFAPRKQNHQGAGQGNRLSGLRRYKGCLPHLPTLTRPLGPASFHFTHPNSNPKGRFCLRKSQFLPHAGAQREGPRTQRTHSAPLWQQLWAHTGSCVS